MSIATSYNPLGYIGPLLGRSIKTCDWDEKLPKELIVRWSKWKKGLSSLDNYSIPLDFREVKRMQLHHFADASEDRGYGTTLYLHFIIKAGKVYVSFVMGKSWVRLLRSGVRGLEGLIKIDAITFWTDSVIVLRCILNDCERFVTFGANVTQLYSCNQRGI